MIRSVRRLAKPTCTLLMTMAMVAMLMYGVASGINMAREAELFYPAQIFIGGD